MQITTKAWLDYIKKMSGISKAAADQMQAWIGKNGFGDDKALLDYAYALSEKYGAAIGALSCEMYEATATAQGANIAPAMPVDTPEYGEVAKIINGAKKQSESLVPSAMGRIIKQVGADTTLQNAIRDGAQFAWVPYGETCAFCLTLASRGWQNISKKILKKGHAEHIHANCDCQYSVRFDGKSSVEGYDPDKYLKMYNEAEGSTPTEKINSMRRALSSKKDLQVHSYDITQDFIKKARPGVGKLIYEKSTSAEDREMCLWLHNNVGGDITCLEEKPEIGKMPDAIWDGVYYEFKAPKTKNAIDKRIQKAQRQLQEALNRDGKADAERGMVIDISKSSLSREEAVKAIENSSIKRAKGKMTVVIREKDKTVKVFAIK